MSSNAVIQNLHATRQRFFARNTPTSQPAEKHRWRVPEVVLGLVMMMGGALGAVLLSRDSLVTVVGISHDLARGTVIQANDLQAMEMPLTISNTFIKGDEAKKLIGQTVLIDLASGTYLTEKMLTRFSELTPGEALTSAPVNVGDYPSELAIGDPVRVVTIPNPTISGSLEPVMFDRVVTVWSIENPEHNNFAVVTFRGNLELSIAVARSSEVHIVRVAD